MVMRARAAQPVIDVNPQGAEGLGVALVHHPQDLRPRRFVTGPRAAAPERANDC
jgi:hypothetical protein